MRGVREALRRSAVEGKLRCERKAGAFLAGVQKHKGGRPGKTGNGVLPVLDDHGVSKMQSSRWQRLASIPDDEFDAIEIEGTSRVGFKRRPAGRPGVGTRTNYEIFCDVRHIRQQAR